MPNKTPCDLGGLNVLITRPQEQANALAGLVQQMHGRPICFPAMEILGAADKQAAQTAFAKLHNTDLLIFISANAVRHAFPLMPENIPLDLPVAAIGRATAEALDAIGLAPALTPHSQPSSEGLLALPGMQQVAGKQIVIVRGNGGRETLKQVLKKRGAAVSYIEVYRRRIPQRNPANLIANWADMVDVVTISSGAILQNLCTMLGEGGMALLQTTPLLVANERIAQQAADLGCASIYVAASALDKDVVQALCEMLAET